MIDYKLAVKSLQKYRKNMENIDAINIKYPTHSDAYVWVFLSTIDNSLISRRTRILNQTVHWRYNQVLDRGIIKLIVKNNPWVFAAKLLIIDVLFIRLPWYPKYEYKKIFWQQYVV